MNLLILTPARDHVEFAYLRSSGQLRHGPSVPVPAPTPDDLRHVWRDLASEPAPDAIGVRCLFGGDRFPEPAVLSGETFARLTELIPQAPLHVPPLIALLHASQAAFPAIPTTLVFETSFFADLPRREQLYGLELGLMTGAGMRKYGFHGIYHQAAARHAARTWPDACPIRILSICLEAKPEIAAVIGSRPVMVSGGATPIEGIPGHTSCGELDPAIALRLADQLDVGPECVDRILSRESGLKGMLDRDVSLADVFESSDDDCLFARRLLEYRILRSCGAGIAALNGLDGIVFSGQFARLARVLGPWLSRRFAFPVLKPLPDIPWIPFDTPVEQLVAEAALAATLPLPSGTTA